MDLHDLERRWSLTWPVWRRRRQHYLAEPKTKKPVIFYYGALGFGFSAGFKLPKIGKAHLPGLAGSSRSFPSFGQVYMNCQFEKSELKVEDISAGFCFLEVALGAVWGGAGYAMVFGMNIAQIGVPCIIDGFGSQSRVTADMLAMLASTARAK